jgi:hypothetical protein
MEKIMKSVTELAKTFEVTPKELNLILLELGFQQRGQKGGYILLKEKLGIQKIYKGKGNSNPFIVWKDFILKNNALKRAVKEFKTPISEVKTEVKTEAKTEVKTEAKTEVKTEHKEAFKFDIAMFPAEYRTCDGHFVRSRAEVIID